MAESQSQALQNRLNTLEERIAFQDDMLQKLDDAMSDQQQQLMEINHKIDLLIDQLDKQESNFAPSNGEEKPPHY